MVSRGRAVPGHGAATVAAGFTVLRRTKELAWILVGYALASRELGASSPATRVPSPRAG
jgi:hypothetical protein